MEFMQKITADVAALKAKTKEQVERICNIEALGLATKHAIDLCTTSVPLKWAVSTAPSRATHYIGHPKQPKDVRRFRELGLHAKGQWTEQELKQIIHQQSKSKNALILTLFIDYY